jgi:hypothetical protein
MYGVMIDPDAERSHAIANPVNAAFRLLTGWSSGASGAIHEALDNHQRSFAP